jgi:uncharacterized protein (TIGR00255 family)
MTGFGRGECIRHDRRFKVEDIVRGKVDIWVNFESFTADDVSVHVNGIYADAYIKALWGLSRQYGLGDVPLDTILELLAKTPDVIVSDRYDHALSSDSAVNEIWEGLSEALEQALQQFHYMRETEGAALEKDIKENLSRCRELIKKIRRRVPRAIEEYSRKLKERVKELTEKFEGKFDDSRFLTEIALIADKTDIGEEMTRLDSHLEQLKEMLTENSAVGRKMDFLVQELNREANTIGAKSGDIQLTKHVVELKSIIEKIREQIQNIE